VALTPAYLTLGVLAHAKSYGLLLVLLTGKRYYEAQQRVLGLQHTQAATELRALRAQLDPHFLFNNLHVLQILIGQDAEVAEQFLNRFAGLYHYLLRYREADFVPLSDELNFLHEYTYLLGHRFGRAYQFRTTLAPGVQPGQLYIVPGTVQLLLENALKHNLGHEAQPLLVDIVVEQSSLLVRHPRRPKPLAAPSAGFGLSNLRQRYLLLAGTPVQVTATAELFAVQVPLSHQLPTPPTA
jgi:LytS/YehU family sensor histidine kinase